MSSKQPIKSKRAPEALIYGGGLMGQAIRDKNWSGTDLGPLENWSPRLLAILNMIVESRFPYFLFWGDQSLCFFNDAYLPSLGKDFDIEAKLGIPGEIFWKGDVWDNVASKEIQKIKDGELPEWNIDALVPIYRNGKVEDVYWTFSYSALRGKYGAITGVLVTCMETTEKVFAYKEVTASRNQLHFALEAANLATWEWDLQADTLQGNERLTEWFKQPESTGLKIQSFIDKIHPSYVESVQEAIAAALNPENSPYYNQVYGVGSDEDNLRMVRAIGKVSFNERKEPLRFNGVLQDITKKFVAEREQRKLLSLFDSSNELIVLTDGNGVITHCNAAGKSFLGRVKLRTSRLLDYIHPEDFNETRILLDSLSINSDLSMELRFLNGENGSVTWMLTNFSIIRETYTDVITGIAISASNINSIKEKERLLKQYNDSLKESEVRFKKLADTTPAFIFMTDVYGKFQFVNKQWRTFLKLKKKELLNKTIYNHIHADDIAVYVDAYEKAIKTSSRFKLEYRVKKADGSFVWLSNVGVPRYNLDGTFDGYTHAAMNIQDLKTQEEQKDLFIGMASHELNTPVTSIKGYIQLLKMRYGASEDKFLSKTLETVDSQITLLTSLIKDLLDLSKMKVGGLELIKSTFAFEPFLKEIIEQQQIINESHVYNLTGDAGVTLTADRERLKQVLLNFLTNAVKYAPQSKKIDIQVTKKENEVAVYVTDYGIGINKVNEEKVFNRFFREEGSDEKTFPGFGIGLFIAADIIRKHQGTIGVTSKKGQGSTFYFTLPI
ncbi:MAG: PAS domain S-box protein [Nonlabens sp.]|nr:PAS domain S-box protein [Nonlabens sp.]